MEWRRPFAVQAREVTTMKRRSLSAIGLLLALWLCGHAVAMAQTTIYRSIDENGNVVFSDEPPSDDAEPIVLKESNVVSSVRAQPAPRSGGTDDNAVPAYAVSFVSPEPEETFWGTGNDLSVELAVDPMMAAGMQIRLFIDDQQVASIGSLEVTLQQIDRGTHVIRAELVDGTGRLLARSEPVTFFMKQFSQNFGN
jgi:hypothetical protein